MAKLSKEQTDKIIDGHSSYLIEKIEVLLSIFKSSIVKNESNTKKVEQYLKVVQSLENKLGILKYSNPENITESHKSVLLEYDIQQKFNEPLKKLLLAITSYQQVKSNSKNSTEIKISEKEFIDSLNTFHKNLIVAIPKEFKSAENIAKQEEELKAKQEQELKAKQEQELKAKQEQELKAKREQELKAKQEQELKAKQEQELKAKQEQELKAKQEQELKAKQEQELKAKQEQELKAKQEQELKAKQEQELKAKQEQELKAKQEQELKAKQEQELKAKQEQELKAKQEEELKAKQEQEIKAKQEQELKAKQEQELKAKQEQELKAKQEEELKVKQEEELKAKQEEELKAKQEQEIKAKQEEELKAKQEEELKAKQEQELKAKQEQELKAKQEEEQLTDNQEEELESKADTDTEAKSEAKPEDKSEAKPEAKSEAKPEDKIEATTKDKIEATTEDTPEAKKSHPEPILSKPFEVNFDLQSDLPPRLKELISRISEHINNRDHLDDIRDLINAVLITYDCESDKQAMLKCFDPNKIQTTDYAIIIYKVHNIFNNKRVVENKDSSYNKLPKRKPAVEKVKATITAHIEQPQTVATDEQHKDDETILVQDNKQHSDSTDKDLKLDQKPEQNHLEPSTEKQEQVNIIESEHNSKHKVETAAHKVITKGALKIKLPHETADDLKKALGKNDIKNAKLILAHLARDIKKQDKHDNDDYQILIEAIKAVGKNSTLNLSLGGSVNVPLLILDSTFKPVENTSKHKKVTGNPKTLNVSTQIISPTNASKEYLKGRNLPLNKNPDKHRNLAEYLAKRLDTDEIRPEELKQWSEHRIKMVKQKKPANDHQVSDIIDEYQILIDICNDKIDNNKQNKTI